MADHDHAHGSAHKNLTVNVTGMTCAHCEEKVVEAIKALGLDVHDLVADHEKGVVTMCMDSNYEAVEAKVKEAIENSGFHYQGCGHDHGH